MADKHATAAAAKKRPKPLRFFREAKAEFKKVVWPTRKQVINNTTVVVISMLVAGLFIWGLDTVLGQIIKLALGNG